LATLKIKGPARFARPKPLNLVEKRKCEPLKWKKMYKINYCSLNRTEILTRCIFITCSSGKSRNKTAETLATHFMSLLCPSLEAAKNTAALVFS